MCRRRRPAREQGRQRVQPVRVERCWLRRWPVGPPSVCKVLCVVRESRTVHRARASHMCGCWHKRSNVDVGFGLWGPLVLAPLS